MRKLLKRTFLVMTLLALVLLAVTACQKPLPEQTDPSNEQQTGPVMYSLNLSADKTVVSRGDTVNLAAVIKGSDGSEAADPDAVVSIVSGFEYASLNGNVLTVNQTAKDGDQIVLQARSGATDSNTVTVTVGVPAESITADVGGITNVMAGQSVILNKTVNPQGAESSVAWTLIEGKDSAVISGDVLVVNQSALTGTKIKVQASVGTVTSNVIELTVGYPLEGLTATFIGQTNLIAGSSAQLKAVLNPQNATGVSYEWVIVEGADSAVVSGDILIVNSTAVTGTKIKVKAVASDVESNVLEFTVGYPLEKITAQLIGSANVKNGNSVQLVAALTPQNATNGAYRWVIVEGDDLVDIQGDILTVLDDAPIGSQIKVKAVCGAIESNVITIHVGTPIETITASTTAPAVLDRGGNYPVSYTFTPNAATADSIEWIVKTGADYATVSGGMLFIDKNTPAGTTVEIYAASGNVASNVLAFTVGVVLESIEIELDGSANVNPDGSRTVTVTLNPTDASDTAVTWVITEGADYATVKNGLVTVKSDAPIGAKVVFHAEIGQIKSNDLTVTVGTPITEIKIEALGSTSVVKGNTVSLGITLTPQNASASLVTWVITEGSEYASVKGSTLVVNSDAKTGATVKIKAVFGDVESNELEFTVAATQEEINKQKYVLSLNKDDLKIDLKDYVSTASIIATVYNGNWEKVTDLDLEFAVTSGSQFLDLVGEGYSRTLVAKGHGKATVTVTVKGTDKSATVEVEVIVPPDAMNLPEVFKERQDIDYAFSHKNPTTGEKEKLPFVPTAISEYALACKDYKVTFKHESGVTGDEVATYDKSTGEITFYKTGKITLTVISDSGSRIEASNTYTFDINEGYNVHNYIELNRLIRSNEYTDQIINLVVMQKPDGSATGYTYGYDIVPPVALLSHAEQTIDKILRGDTSIDSYYTSNRIQAVNKGLYLNGNNHKFDVSQMRIFTQAEYDGYANRYQLTGSDYFANVSSFLSVEPWTSTGEDSDATRKTYSVRLYNLEVIGNCPVDFAGEKDGSGVIGCYTDGIYIGTRVYETQYYVEANNLTATAFKNGVTFSSVVGNGKVSNVKAYNCYSTGLVVRSSIITFENMTFGVCGATAIEIAPENCDKAGINNDQNQQVTLAGTITADTNLNNGNTLYFQNYTIQGETVPKIIEGNVAQYPDIWVSHIRNSEKQFIFVSLIFNDLTTLAPNTSEVIYPAFQEGGIIDITDLPTDGSVDTTHEYVRMPIYVTLPALGTVQAGTALFYNMNYGK